MSKISKMSINELESELFNGPDEATMWDIDTVVRSRSGIIQIVSPEEGRVAYRLRQLAKLRGRKIIFWTCASGLYEYDDDDQKKPYDMKVGGRPWDGLSGRLPFDPLTILDFIEVDDDIPAAQVAQYEKNGKKQSCSLGGGANYVLFDLPNFMPSSKDGARMTDGEIMLVRKLKDLREELLKNEEDKKTVIIFSRDIFIPSDLKKIIPVIDWPLPNQNAITQHLEPLAKEVEKAYTKAHINKKFDKEDLSMLSSSLLGLTLDEVTNTFRQSAVRNPDKTSIDGFIKHNIKSKKDIIRKSRSGLEFYETDLSIKNSVGGLSELKKWLAKRAGAYSEAAIEYGLEYPKGLLIVGIPGNGKSLIAKAIANEWNKLLLRWDVGTVYSGVVGSSEANIRTAIHTAEATAPCILWIDEIEKAFAGIGSSDRSDGGTAARVFSTFLQWLSEKQTPVFVVATANRIDQLPAELIRKGRFDEVFYVDLPYKEEREEIIKIHLQKRNFNIQNYDLSAIVDVTEDFTGAEIENVIKESMYTAFADNARIMNTEDIIAEAQTSVPLALTMGPQIDELRQWASTKAKWASQRNSSKETLKKQLREKQLKRADNDTGGSGGIEVIDYTQGPNLGDGPQESDE